LPVAPAEDAAALPEPAGFEAPPVPDPSPPVLLLERSPSLVPPPVDAAAAPDSLAFDAARRAVAVRSFLAQPDPLNSTAGGANAFRIVPTLPQFGQTSGPDSWMPWSTSVTWPHTEQE
jgi:hypothetical protein